MEDRQIIELYWQRKEAAISESDKKYGNYCFTLSDNILKNHEDAEECVNDTWLRAWNSMPPQRPERLRMFFAKITRNLSFDRYDANTAQKRGGSETTLVLEELSECLASDSDVEAEALDDALGECIRSFVSSLSVRDGNIFVRRYFFTEPVREIAQRYGMSPNHVMVVLSRTRKRLRALLEQEGYIDGQK